MKKIALLFLSIVMIVLTGCTKSEPVKFTMQTDKETNTPFIISKDENITVMPSIVNHDYTYTIVIENRDLNELKRICHYIIESQWKDESFRKYALERFNADYDEFSNNEIINKNYSFSDDYSIETFDIGNGYPKSIGHGMQSHPKYGHRVFLSAWGTQTVDKSYYGKEKDADRVSYYRILSELTQPLVQSISDTLKKHHYKFDGFE